MTEPELLPVPVESWSPMPPSAPAPTSPGGSRRSSPLAARLDALYAHYATPAYLFSDPLELVLPYHQLDDREIVGFFAAALAYGNVTSIRRSLRDLLGRLGPAPAAFVDDASPQERTMVINGFQHRWTRAAEVVEVLASMQRMRRTWGSLHQAFLAGHRQDCENVVPALTAWTDRLRGPNRDKNSLVPDPRGGSACKRLCLFLRWMVRQDAVDPGGWTGISPAQLVVPIDVHMFRVAHLLRLTRRRTVSLSTALEITAGFRRFRAEDPLRYDFALTRPGILRETVAWADA